MYNQIVRGIILKTPKIDSIQQWVRTIVFSPQPPFLQSAKGQWWVRSPRQLYQRGSRLLFVVPNNHLHILSMAVGGCDQIQYTMSSSTI